MKPKIYFRVNIAKSQGLGHWMRCISLAEILLENFESVFLLKTCDERFIDQTTDFGFQCYAIPEDLKLHEEPKYIQQNFAVGNSIMILDGYQFNTKYQKNMRNCTGRLVCIDDIHQGEFLADVVINHGVGSQPSDYILADYTQLYLGLKYLMLRKPFFEKIKTVSQPKDNGKVFICMGGEDSENASLEVLQFCELNQAIKECELILGNAFSNIEAINTFIDKSRMKVNISKGISAKEMVDKMSQCPTAICAPSAIALEYLCVSGNLFLKQTAENQNHIYNHLIENNLAFDWQNCGTVDAAKLEQSRINQSAIIDGQSPTRLINIFNRLQDTLKYTFRSANHGDMEKYYQWVNEKMTRLQSFQSEPVDFSTHQNWFEQQLQSSSTALIIMEERGIPIGQIRFTIATNTATINYSLDKGSRGKRLAGRLIAEGISELQYYFPNIKTIKGYVKQDNEPSIRTFRRLGFQEEKNQIASTQVMFFQNLN